MGLESPVRRSVHACGCKSGEAEVVLAGCNVFYDRLEAVKICDVIRRVACFFQKRLVVNDPVVLNHVGDARHLVPIHQGEAVVCQFSRNIRTGQVVTVILPACQSDRSVHLEQRRGVCLCHLGFQRLLILAGSRRQHGHRHAGLVCISLRQLLPVLIRLRLKVQIIYLSFRLFRTAFFGTGIASAACHQSCRHCRSQYDR